MLFCVFGFWFGLAASCRGKVMMNMKLVLRTMVKLLPIHGESIGGLWTMVKQGDNDNGCVCRLQWGGGMMCDWVWWRERAEKQRIMGWWMKLVWTCAYGHIWLVWTCAYGHIWWWAWWAWGSINKNNSGWTTLNS